ncbi:MAG: hypothetical protein IKQ80_07880 [Clostridia bacterium]|nr:hypothetical protein [Clostridia bacterium]
MKKLMSKLRSAAGETIGETLVALLISALALTMLAGAIGAANNIVTRSNKAMNDYYTKTGTGLSDTTSECYKWYDEVRKKIL